MLPRRTFLPTLGIACLVVLLAVPAKAATYGLTIGINDYLGRSNDLAGAVNDAEDIAAALTAAGAAEVVLLTDGAATKAAIESAWLRLVETARPGDTIVFSYAGHGGQEPEPPGRNGEVDGLNETFVLGGYQSIGPAAAERIVDDEIFAWLSMAEQRGIEVIFVADSCHSGTMYRAVSGPALRYRMGDFEPPAEEFPLPDPAFATTEEIDFERVTFIGATQEDRLTPELMIDGVPRGALSWAFARAIEGAADRDGDNTLTQYELLDFLVPAVEIQAQNQQTPSILPFAPEPKSLIAIGEAVETAVRQPAAPGALHALNLFVIGEANLPAGVTAKMTADIAAADLIWDAVTGAVDHPLAGHIADDVGPDEIGGLVEKWSTVAVLQTVAALDPFPMTLLNGNAVHLPGEVLTIEIGPAARPYLTLFNLAPNGRVEPLLPADAEDVLASWQGIATSVQLQVAEPPYGGEHLIAILTDEPPLALQAALGTMADRQDSTGLADLLAGFVADNSAQIGILGIYTAAE